MKYVYRGLVLFDYNEETGEMLTTNYEGTDIPNINMCRYDDECYELMEQFFKNINEHRKDNTFKLEDIVVN